jgi:hypothetical protein
VCRGKKVSGERAVATGAKARVGEPII